MTHTVFVRFPDSIKEDPDLPDVPNPVKKIVAHKLDDYRAQGYVQCASDGSALRPEDVIPSQSTVLATAGPGLAKRSSDPEAAKIAPEAIAEADAAAYAAAKKAAGAAGPGSAKPAADTEKGGN